MHVRTIFVSRRIAGAFSVAVPFLLPACAQSPQSVEPPPAIQAAAVEANLRGEAMFRRGDFERSAQSYREALRLSQSVEDMKGIATNAINLSIALQRAGKFNDARASLGAILDRSRLPFAPAQVAQAALRRAVLDFDEGKRDSATEWIEKSAALCAGQSCAFTGAIHNVKGQLALDAGKLDEAAASARLAQSASQSANDRAETANALRLLGMIALQNKDAASAQARLVEALAIDRQLALPRKIHLDLIHLGHASGLRGDNAAAKDYYERALAVSEADRDSKGAAEARTLIEALGGKR